MPITGNPTIRTQETRLIDVMVMGVKRIDYSTKGRKQEGRNR
jgi:hypothetical protein